ncbi:MAG: DUF5985 family protein [Stellaceae bacterium]
MLLPSVVYFLCCIVSILAMWLVYRSYRRTPTRLLLWSSLAFVALAINNFLLFIDVIILPTQISLLAPRHAAALIAVALLLYGFIWEAE